MADSLSKVVNLIYGEIWIYKGYIPLDVIQSWFIISYNVILFSGSFINIFLRRSTNREFASAGYSGLKKILMFILTHYSWLYYKELVYY